MDILALLQIKKEPKKKEDFNIVIPAQMQEATLKTNIVDKSATSGFNRTAFINSLNAPMEEEPIEEPITTLFPEEPTTTLFPEEPTTLFPEEPTTLFPEEPTTLFPEEPIIEEPPLEDLESGNIVIIKPKRKTAPKTKKYEIVLNKEVTIQEGQFENSVTINGVSIADRLGQKEEIKKISALPYYMNNRAIFVNYISGLFEKYKEELVIESQNASCPADDQETAFSLMTHQKIVRDYINLYTPYRGLLLYHGLGSGKTCSSIAIAEGMKSSKQVMIMTPAALRVNYLEELKKCGDSLYYKNQFWEFINARENPQLIEILRVILSLPIAYIKENDGAWLINIKKKSNYDSLSPDQKLSLDKQIFVMIAHKYTFVSYNGLRKTNLSKLTNNNTINPFDNKVVIIDEAHNFVSRIVNKLNRKDKDMTLSVILYNYLMNAKNVKIVLLTGTPIINYPNEIAVLFNILRGKINTWIFNLITPENKDVINEEYFKLLFKSTLLGGNIMDYINYRPAQNILAITRNPFGFVNQTQEQKYKGIRIGERGEITDERFVELVIKILDDNNIRVKHDIIKDPLSGKNIKNYAVSFESYKSLPDSLDEFKGYFINDKNELQNPVLLKRRILGLTSYFRSAQENLMPKFDKKTADFKVYHIPMSEHQFRYYELERVAERTREAKNASKKKMSGVFEDSSSTYRIFSRTACNFVFPYPEITRPKPVMDDNKIDEDVMDLATKEDKINNVDGIYEADEIEEEEEPVKVSATSEYERNILTALSELEKGREKYLSPTGLLTYSPKFLEMLNNLQNEEYPGLHLIYSQFRTLEGIGILKLVLEANGFAQFKIVKQDTTWKLAIKEEDMFKPKFVLYTGTETAEEKEHIRNIFNGKWKYVPPSISKELIKISPSNIMGEIIKIFMITSSGAEGISLKNVRYVHITEPYWHPVRMEQVIGRARRICSHQDLPPELRTVNVFLYLMTLSKEQIESESSSSLRLKDVSKINGKPLTSDEALFEISNIKESLTTQLLTAVKESSFDCTLHSNPGSKEALNCFSYGSSDSSKFISKPNLSDEEKDIDYMKNKTTKNFKAQEITAKGVKYIYNSEDDSVYSFDSYQKGELLQIGKLVKGKLIKI